MNKYEKALQKVRNALEQLEVSGDLLVKDIDGHSEQLQVFVNGEYFGICDTVRNTFVD